MLADIIFEACLLLLTLASTAVLLFGVAICILPEKIEALVAPLNHWISTEVAINRINHSHNIERFFYRHHIFMGVFIIAGALFSVYMFVIGIDGLTVISAYQRMEQSWATLGLFEALIYILLFLNCLAIMIGLVVVLRPSLLKNLENWSNNWVSTEEILKPLDANVDTSGNWLPKHPRIFGLLVALGSLYILLNLGSQAG